MMVGKAWRAAVALPVGDTARLRAARIAVLAVLSALLLPAAALATDGDLSTYGTAGSGNTGTPIAAGTSPAIAGLSGGGYEIVWQPDSGILTASGPVASGQLGLVMAPGTSPAIAGLGSDGYEVAFQGQNTSLWTTGSAGVDDFGLGMESGSSPAITGLSGGGYQAAMQANTSVLWTAGTAGTTDTGQGMNLKSDPGIAADGTSYAATFEANTDALYTYGPSPGPAMIPLGMEGGTSPSVAALTTGGDIYAFQANTGILWTYGSGSTGNSGLAMANGTNPSVAALAQGGYEVAFQSSAGDLTLAGSAGTVNTGLSMASGTSPSISGLADGGYEVAYQAAPVVPVPVQTAPVATPISEPGSTAKHSHQLNVQVSAKWNWKHGRTRLSRLRLGKRPRGTVFTIACQGRGCSIHHSESAKGAKQLKRLEQQLKGMVFLAGDRVLITLRAPGYISERAVVRIRNSLKPAVEVK